MNSFKVLLSTHFLASSADILRGASRVHCPTNVRGAGTRDAPLCQFGRERSHFLVKFNHSNDSFFHVERCLGTCWLFSGYMYTLSKPSWILFLLTIKIFKDDEKLWANVTFPYKTLIRLRACLHGVG